MADLVMEAYFLEFWRLIKWTYNALLKQYYIEYKIAQGTFGKVYKAYDIQDNRHVAIKMMMSRKHFHLAVQEMQFVEKMNAIDKENTSCIIQLNHYFLYKGCACLVFEFMVKDLYTVIQEKQISLSTIRNYAKQIFTALTFLSRPDVNIVHGDLKPENILLSSDLKRIKIADFGISCYVGTPNITCIQSRYYRAPEVLLGIPFGVQIDMWSVGCIFAEMYSGEPLFNGSDEFDQMNKIVEMFGIPPNRMLDSGIKTKNYFYQKYKKRSYKVIYYKYLYYKWPGTRSLDTALNLNRTRRDRQQVKSVNYSPLFKKFKNFLRKILQLDPTTRIKASAALQHKFMRQ